MPVRCFLLANDGKNGPAALSASVLMIYLPGKIEQNMVSARRAM